MAIGCGVGVSGELLGYKLIGLRQAIDSLELEFAQTAADFAHTNEYDEQGSTSPIDWIRHTCHMTSTTAAACLAVGKNLERLPESVQDDTCELDRRLADALVELAEGSMPSPQIQGTSSVETLLGLAGAPAAEMDFALPISSKTVERFACYSGITRVLLGSESTVIDVGRSKRTVSAPARRALNARDGHCRWPGCDRPAKWSAAHHLVHWIHGGSTDLSNLILLCHRHHWMVHEGRWQIVRSDDGRMLTIPPTTTFGQLARGPD